jgi:hypothetical protein
VHVVPASGTPLEPPELEPPPPKSPPELLLLPPDDELELLELDELELLELDDELLDDSPPELDELSSLLHARP